MSPEKKVCAHFVIDTDGKMFDLGKFLENEKFLLGAHAGKSVWIKNGHKREALNHCSIGIELVNLNGNVFAYPEVQLESLYELLLALKPLCPGLVVAESIVGHEQIAGFRGKCDPGILFPWDELFHKVYPDQVAPERLPRMSEDEASKLAEYVALVPSSLKKAPDFWSQLSSDLEKV